jgi:hypothetical protein
VIALSLILAVSMSAAAQGQEPGENLEFMHRLLGKTWVGHYSNPEDAHYVHVMEWAPVLGGSSIRLSKRVDELAFEMETTYYWDPLEQQVAFVSLTNRGQLSEGVVKAEDGAVVLYGDMIEEGGTRAFKTTYSLQEDGSLEDRFFLKTGDQWKQRHLITLTPAKEDEH